MAKKTGRPPRYLKKHCKTAEEVLGKGHSFTQLCSDLEISTKTGYQWKKKHPEFGNAVEKAKTKGKALWMRWIMAGAMGVKQITIDGEQVTMNPQYLTLYLRNTYNISTTDSEARMQGQIEEMERTIEELEQALRA